MKDRENLDRLQKAWTVFRSARWLEAGQYSGNYGRMERMYLLEDPWKLASPRESARFALTNAVIAQIAPNCAALLEIGSGEGMQTKELLKVSRSVTGIEVSGVAVERAQRAAPAAEFIVGRAEDARALLGARRFDLVTACEVLYYAPDVENMLATLQSLAPRILVTSYEKRAKRLSRHLEGPGWKRLETMEAYGMRWWFYLWCAPEPSLADWPQ
ncbi:class I SAM-dependent methyltransferase [Sphingomonas koreensis]